MGWLTQVVEPRASYSNTDDFWYNPIGDARNTTTGMPAGENAAMHVSPFFNGLRILSETVAQPPLIVYERTGDDQKEKASDTLLYSVLHDQPNSFQSSYEYRLLQTMSMLLGGNAYSEIVGGRRGAVDELRPLLCGRMRVKMLANGNLGYMYRNNNNTETPYTQDEIFHVRAFPLNADGVTGQSLLTYARETTGLSLATETYGARLFRHDLKRAGNFSVPGTLKPEDRDRIKMLLQTEDTLVLEAGATWVDRGMTARDAEFLLTRKFGIAEWARWLNLPPHLLKDLEQSTNNNIEHQGLEFLQFSMMPYFINWEQAISRDLIVQKNRFFAEFLVDGLVRADIQTRYNAYGTAINTGFMTRNQARGKENWNRIEGLDAPLVDQNKAIVDKSGKIVPVSGPPAPKPPTLREEQQAHYRQLLRGSAERVMRKEANAIGREWEKDRKSPDKLIAWADKFYAEHAHFLADALQMSEKQAQTFANDRKDKFLLTINDESCSIYDHVHETEKYGADTLLDFVGERIEKALEAAA